MTTEKSLANTDTNEVARVTSFAPTNFREAMEFAKIIANTDFVPKDYRGKPGNVLVAIQWGAEIGVQPMQAMQNIAVINGRPSIYGDLALAICMSSPACEYIKETFDESTMTATCVAKRRNGHETMVSFSVEDAKQAGLWGKAGPWKSYPKRMLQMRARGFALRDAFPDVLKGLITAEEAQDYPTGANQQPSPEQPRKMSRTEALKAKLAAKNGEVIDADTGVVETVTVEALGQEIDQITSEDDLTNWYRGNIDRIGSLPEEDQARVVELCSMRKAAILDEADSADDGQEDGLFVDCPNGNGRVPVEYCEGECKAFDGCPAHEDAAIAA